MNEDKRMDFDDRETEKELLVNNISEKKLNEELKIIYGEDEYNRLFGESAQ